ncbi:MAG: DUF4363 family protein [Clostridiales bacterium]|nr:DUF4363 family protein [Clostridiales bacterium]
MEKDKSFLKKSYKLYLQFKGRLNYFMKKEFSIIIFLFVIVVLTHMFTQKNTRNFLDSIILDLESIEKDIFNNNIEKDNLSEKIDNIYSKWKEQYKYLAYYIEHDELEKLEIQLISIRANINVEDYDRCIEELEKCMFILNHIETKDSLELINIF